MENLVLSIDIGIRNLAMCIMSCDDKKDLTTYKIHLWNVFDTLDTKEYKCETIQKNGKLCNKQCGYKYMKDDIQLYSCKSHFPKDILPLKKCNFYKKKKINDYLLQDIARIVLQKVQYMYENNTDLFDNLQNICIELQPKINQKMKFISHIIYGKLVELLINKPLCTIRFIRASQKLQAYSGPEIKCTLKGKYAQRKWLSIQYTRWILENKFNPEEKDKWLNLLNSNQAKIDDMTDTFLFCINNLYCSVTKKQKMNFKRTNL